MQSKKIVFVKAGSFSHINKNVVKILQKHFYDLKLEVIDVKDLWKKHSYILIANLFFAFKEFGFKKMLRSKKMFIWYFLSTSYLFKVTKYLISRRLAKESYVFSFQTLAAFDASTERAPHFVYIDSTEMANLYYPYFDKSNLWPESRLELERSVYHNATKNFTMYTRMNKSLIEQYDCAPKKVVCVYAGSNADSNTTNTQRKYENKNILFVGVDWSRKGGPVLAEAFEKVLQIHPDAQLTIVGCYPNLNLPNCNVVGRIPLEEVPRYYESASIFCLPTRFEPFGIVFIEALMHKLPLVATDVGAITDFIIHGENGYLVKPDNSEQLAMSLIALLGEPSKCQTFGERGYRLAVERYSWDKVGSRMREIIEPIINE